MIKSDKHSWQDWNFAGDVFSFLGCRGINPSWCRMILESAAKNDFHHSMSILFVPFHNFSFESFHSLMYVCGRYLVSFGGIDFRANLLVKCVLYYRVIQVGRQPARRPQDREDEKVSLVNYFRNGPSAAGT